MTGTLLLLAMMQVADTTISLDIPVRLPRPNVVLVDSSVVQVEVSHVMDTTLLRRQVEAQEATVLAIQGCECGAGTPDWFYAGMLTLGSAFLYLYNKHGSRREVSMTKDGINIHVTMPKPEDDEATDHPHGHKPGKGKGRGKPGG